MAVYLNLDIIVWISKGGTLLIKNKVIIIIPYFGKLPNYFKLWLESVRRNPDLDVLFLSNNNKPNDCPLNVKWIKTSLKNVKQRAQSLVNFPIVLNTPYKLVDYKPLYGAMFLDYIDDYDWWGYGDVDTIWGNLALIINDNNLEKYDKILDLGHLTLLKNTDFMRNLWKQKISGAWTYKDAFKSNLIYHFDEGGGMSFIAQKLNCKIYTEPAGKMSFADIIPNKHYFELAYDQGDGKYAHIFTWKNGNLRGYWIKNNKIQYKDFSYIHLQKRKMTIAEDLHDVNQGFLIIPNAFLLLAGRKINKKLFKKTVICNDKKSEKGVSFISCLVTHFQVSEFKRKGRNRKIPLNGNEVYFKVEEPKY